ARIKVDDDKPADKNTDQGVPADAPDRFVAYLFDDIHMNAGEIIRMRAAAQSHMESLVATDRAAIYTTSGQVEMEFTDDRGRFHETLLKLMPRPIASGGLGMCPNISYYMGDMIANKNDRTALDAATQETLSCYNMDPSDPMQVSQ